MADHAGIAKPHVAQTLKVAVSELLSCVKVEVDVLGLQITVSPYGICGRKGTLKKKEKKVAFDLALSTCRRATWLASPRPLRLLTLKQRATLAQIFGDLPHMFTHSFISILAVGPIGWVPEHMTIKNIHFSFSSPVVAVSSPIFRRSILFAINNGRSPSHANN